MIGCCLLRLIQNAVWAEIHGTDCSGQTKQIEDDNHRMRQENSMKLERMKQDMLSKK